MKRLTYKTWNDSFRWHYIAYPFFTSAYIKNAAPQINSSYYLHWSWFLSRFDDGQFTGFTPRQPLIKLGTKVMTETLEGDTGYSEELQAVHKQIREAIRLCMASRQRGEFKQIEKWWPKTQAALSNICDLFFHFDFALDEFLARLSRREPQLYRNLNSYILGGRPSFVNEATDELHELIESYPNNFPKVYQSFHKKYGWFQNSYAGIFPVTLKWLRQFSSKDTQPQNKRTGKPIPLAMLPKKYQAIAKLSRLAVKVRDDKKKLLLIAVDLLEPWLRSLCKEHGWNYNDMRWLSVDEVLSAVHDQTIIKKLKITPDKQAVLAS